MAGWFQKAASRVRSLAAGTARFPGRALVFFDLNRPAEADILDDVGDGTSSDVLMTPIRWLQRAIVEAPWQQLDMNGDPLDDGGDLVDLLNDPNPYYDGETLLQGTTMSLALDGNAYWVAALNREGRPVELYYAPHLSVTPRWDDTDSSSFLTHYEYKIQGGTQKIAPAGIEESDLPPGMAKALRIVHFRDGIDPTNLRKGLSSVRGLLREIWTDNEAARFTATLLRNNGVPGLVVSPSNQDHLLTKEEGEAAEAKIRAKYTGEGRGAPLVMLGATRVDQFGFSPKDMDLSPLRDISEERVTAALGIPAAVVGFGSGLQQTKVGATMKELRKLAWFSAVIPMQRRLATTVSKRLGPHFDARVRFDTSEVEALQENQDSRVSRVERLVRAAILTRAEARGELGWESDPSDNVYLMSMATIEVPMGRPAMPPAAASDETRAWADAYLRKEHSHGGAEDRIIEAAPKRTAPAAVLRTARALNTVRRAATSAFESGVRRVFEDFGRAAFRVALEVLDATEQLSARSAETKQGDLGPVELDILGKIMASLDIVGVQANLQRALEDGYLATAQLAADALGDAFPLGDAAQRNVLQAGGLRAGLIDMDVQTRAALFSALEEARDEGLTAENLARRIRSHVEAGPWRDAATRARVIARTEGANAANVATLEAARAAEDTEHVMVFDNRSGYDDEACVAANGAIITLDEADSIGLAHPNCTRGFVPVNALLMEEMGL